MNLNFDNIYRAIIFALLKSKWLFLRIVVDTPKNNYFSDLQKQIAISNFFRNQMQIHGET